MQFTDTTYFHLILIIYTEPTATDNKPTIATNRSNVIVIAVCIVVVIMAIIVVISVILLMIYLRQRGKPNNYIFTHYMCLNCCCFCFSCCFFFKGTVSVD